MSDSYYIPDITGIDPRYKVNNDIYTVTRTGMILDFDTPIYYDTLKIVSSQDGSVWSDPSNYSISVRDDTAESRAHNMDSSYSYRLVRSIVINTNVITPFQISVSYQRFYPPTPTDPISSEDGVVNLTPALISNMLRRLLSVENKSLMVGASSIPTDGKVIALQYDINGTNPSNQITDEIHSVNTFNGQNIIFPTQGAFFKDSVSISINGNNLVRDKDFIVGKFDRYRTEVSTNRSGIYRCIVLLTSYAGDNLNLSYHAVGGKATVEDINRLEASQQDIVKFLNGNQYLTSPMLRDDPFLNGLSNRISLMEKEMRAFSQTPTYGKTSSGTTVTRTLKTNDTQLHWWTIASLYTVDGQNEVFTADTFKAHIEMPDRHFQADVIINVDIKNPNFPMKISSSNVLYDQGYSINGKNKTINIPPTILFRIIYNETSDNSSGVLLQIGTSIPSLVERFGITDNSGVESAWYLALPQSNDAALPNDVTPITLPNDTRVWSETGNQSYSAISTLPLSEGYLVTSGSIDLTDISNPKVSSNSPYTGVTFLPQWQPITNVSDIRIYYTEKDSQNNTHTGVLQIPTVYNSSTGEIVGQTAVNDFTFNDLSTGTVKVKLTNTQFSLYYNGNSQTPGNFIINYIVANVRGSCNLITYN